jgi:UDP-2-acetamido-3-amino-2,3-dideoxy-glucuronate N-acetyltransferase
MNKSEKFIGLIGLGYWGKNILRNLYELGVLHTACDLDSDVISMRRERFPDVNYTTSPDEIFNDPEIKAIAVATPAVTHYEFAKRALLSGRDVFVEKPLSMKVNEGEELVRLADQMGRILMVGHILRYHPAVRRLKELISSGRLGKVEYIYSNRLNIGKLRIEENILWSFAPHDISVILMLLGEEPIGVSAFGGYYLNEGIYDTTITMLEFRNGVKAHIFVSWLHPYKEQKLVVVGSEAMAVFDDLTDEKLFIYPHRIEWKDGKIPVAHKADYEVVPVEMSEPLRLELEHFIDCILNRRRPETDGREGVAVLKVLEQAQESLSGAKVKVPSEKYFVHKSSFIDENVEIGEGTKIWHFCHILKNTRIGKNCVLGQNVMVGPNVRIGDRVKIQNNVSVYEGVEIEDEVFCGPSMVFTNVINPRAFIERKSEFKRTLVRRGATIGANATIVCGVTIGRYAFVGAGAVVIKDVPDYALVAGVPARQIGWVCKCGTTLKEFDENKIAVCKYCGSRYELKNDKLIQME